MRPEFPSQESPKPLTLESTEREFVPPFEFDAIAEKIFRGAPSQLWPDARFFKTGDGATSYAVIGSLKPGRPQDIVGGVVDIEDGRVVGWGRFRFVEDVPYEHLKDKPRVTYSESVRGHKLRGRHRRRLEIMNQLSLMETGLPLHSDMQRDREPEATSAWKHLVREGKAIEYQEESDREPGQRFRFKAPGE